MKASIVFCPKETVNPWPTVKYPCLIEDHNGYYAIATSQHAGVVLGKAGDMLLQSYLLEAGKTWEQCNWVPCEESVTMTITN